MAAYSFAKVESILGGGIQRMADKAVPRHAEISNILARKICRDLGIPAI
jgi:hypothetical protein